MSEFSGTCVDCGRLRLADGRCPACMLAHARAGGLSQAERIFQLALSWPETERGAFVEQTCQEDPELLEEVKLLLEGYAGEGGDAADLTLPSGGPKARVAWAAAREEEPGSRIGHFELIRLIGQGGMGTVWEARQKQPVVRQVALKLIKLGMDTREVVARFERERQALVLMNHPHIALAFEAGATDLGRPYFVMELVDGIPITRFCREQALGIPARLELFLQLCGAIEHAHQKGVIHRDLKPGNILVTAAGTLKVIDFGVAKATRESSEIDQTRQAQVLGTPAYMSPEQASGTGVDVDTRTDVYALGVVLYEMLSGQLPFDPVRLSRASVLELQQILTHEEPPRPSTHRGVAGGAGPPEAWRRALRGDLDWITLKCLEKDRHRRYASARAVADEVEAWLENRPVSAAPPRTGYYVRKWVARHRVAFAAGVAVGLSLLLGTIVSLAMARRAGDEAGRATAARAEAERLLQISHHEEGKAWLERGRALEKERNFFAAKLMAGRALGFDGFGRDRMPPGFQERLPVLLDPASAETRSARRILQSFSDYAMLWQSPAAAQHEGVVTAVAFHPTGTWLASCSPAHDLIRMHEVQSGGLHREWASPVPEPVTLDFSPDGQWLAAGGGSAEVPVWKVSGGGPAFSLTALDLRVTRVRFSPDASQLAVGGTTGGVTVFDLHTRAPVATVGKGQGAVMDFALSRDGRTVGVLTADSFVRVYTPGTEAPRYVFPPLEQQSAYTMAMQPDGSRLYVGFALGKTVVWDLGTGKEVSGLFAVQRNQVSSLALSPDGKTLSSGSSRGLMRVCDAATGRELKAWEGHPGWVEQLVMSPDGSILASGGRDQSVRVWKSQDGTPLHPFRGHSAPVLCVGFSPDGRTMASSGQDQTLQLWDPAAGTSRLCPTGETGPVRSLDFDSTGTLLVAAGRSGLLRFWTAADGQRSTRLKAQQASELNAVKFVSDTVLATAGLDGIVRIFEGTTGVETAQHSLHSGEVLCLDVNAAGTWLATGGVDRQVVVWETGGARASRRLEGHVSAVTSVRFSPDGRTLASADRSGTLRFHDMETGLLKNSIISSPQPLLSIDYHPDGSRLVATGQDGALRLWNVNNWKLEAVLEGHLRTVTAVRFSQDGRALLSGSADHTVALWQARGAEVLSRRAHEGAVAGLLWTGGHVISSGADGMVRWWDGTLLNSQAAREQTRHAPAALAAHGDSLIMASGTGWIQVVHRQDGRLLQQFHGHRNRIDSAVFTPDGGQLITVSQDGKMRIWDTASWQMVEQKILREPGLPRPVADYRLALSEEGSRLYCSGENDGSLRVWSLPGFTDLPPVPVHARQVRALDPHPHQPLLAVASGDGTLSIRRTPGLEKIALLRQHTGEVLDVRFDPTGRWLASAGEDQTIVIWDAETWQMTDVLEGHIGAVRCLAFESTGQRLASGSDSGELKIWELHQRDPASLAPAFASWHDDGGRFTARNSLVSSGLAIGPETSAAGVPPQSWLALLQPAPAPQVQFQRALAGGNHAAARKWLASLSPGAAERQAFVASAAGPILRGGADVTPARAAWLLDQAESVQPGDPALPLARAVLAWRQNEPVPAHPAPVTPAPAVPDGDRPAFQLLLSLPDLTAARQRLAEIAASDPAGMILTERYGAYATAWQQRLTPPLPGQPGHESLRALRGLTLLEYFRRAAALRPYDISRLEQWIPQIVAWKALVLPPVPLVPAGAVWSYLEDGSDPGAGWETGGTARNNWLRGAAPLGASTTWKNTTLRRNLSGDAAAPATMAFYFRHSFTRPDLGGRQNLRFTTQYDDGVILYLNGQEVRRINMAPGPATPQTAASGYQNKPGRTVFTIPADGLQQENVLAAQVHQRDNTSSDIFFDLTVDATAASPDDWLASLSPEDIASALAWGRDYLPAPLADSWLPVLEFALAENPGPPPSGMDPAHLWLIRARLQKASAHRAAMEAAQATARDALPGPDARTALQHDLWVYLAELSQW